MLVGALGVGLMATSAQSPNGLSVTIASPSLEGCGGEGTATDPFTVEVGSHCFLEMTASMRSPNNLTGWYTLNITGDDRVLDQGTIAPPAPGRARLVDCACYFGVQHGQSNTHKIRIWPAREAPEGSRPTGVGPGYVTAADLNRDIQLLVFSGLQTDRGAAPIATYHLKLVYTPNNPIMLGRIGAKTIEVTWTADQRAVWVILSWKLSTDQNFVNANRAVRRASSESYVISGLAPLTAYNVSVNVSMGGWGANPSKSMDATTVATKPPCPTSGNNRDYDGDDDGLIEVCTVAQLDAIRYDLDGNGLNPTDASKYQVAFPSPASGMGCPPGGCNGYELANNLVFAATAFDNGGTYHNGGKGWIPIGGDLTVQYRFGTSFFDADKYMPFTAIFEGNGYTIDGLSVNDSERVLSGLFGWVAGGAHIRNVGLTGTGTIYGLQWVGGLAGLVEQATVSGSYSELNVVGGHDPNPAAYIGGLVGKLTGYASGAASPRTYRTAKVVESYATGAVSTATDVRLGASVGGLIGEMSGWSEVTASFSSGAVNAAVPNVGGLVGRNIGGAIRASYASGNVVANTSQSLGSLIGTHWGTIITSYASGSVTSNWGTAQTRLVGHCDQHLWTRYSYWQLAVSVGANSLQPCLRDEYQHGFRYTQWGTGLRVYPVNNVSAQTETALKTPVGYTGIYDHWNIDLDIPLSADEPSHYSLRRGHWLDVPLTVDMTDYAIDDPWDFGTAVQYPILKYCAEKPGIDTSGGSAYCPLTSAAQGR